MINRQHFYFESILMIITFGAGFAALTHDPGALLLGAIWMLILGFLQVIHSVILAIHYFRQRTIAKWLIGYWIATAASLFMLFSPSLLVFGRLNAWLFPVLPLLIATVPWLLSCAYRRERTSTTHQLSPINEVFKDDSDHYKRD